MTGIVLSISGSTVNITHLDGGQEVVSGIANGVGIVYPGERVDFRLEWPETQRDIESILEVRLDKEYGIRISRAPGQQID